MFASEPSQPYFYWIRSHCDPKSRPRTIVKRHFKHYDPEYFLADISVVPFHVAHFGGPRGSLEGVGEIVI